MNSIILGPPDDPLATLEGVAVRGVSFTSTVDVVGSELSIDVLTPVVDYPYNAGSAQVLGGADFGSIVSSDGYVVCSNKRFVDLRLVPYGTVVRYFRDGSLWIKAYVDTVAEQQKPIYRINAISAIGLLHKAQKHGGGIYTGQTFAAVLAEIIGSIVEYTVSPDVANIAIYGWLPRDYRRANLHKLLIATGVMVGRNANGDMDFRFLVNSEAAAIPPERIYIGGETRFADYANIVSVTEHSYMQTATDQTVVEYNNSDGGEVANNTMVTFRSAPLYGLMVDGIEVDTSNLPQTVGNMTIHEAGVNYAVISGTGELSGKQYTHSTHILTLREDDSSNLQERVATISDCTLITALNSLNAARRALAYYSSKRAVKCSIVIEGNKAGDLIAATNSSGDPFSGFLSSINAVASGIVKGDSTVITNFVPTNGGNNYDTVEVLTGSGTFTIEDEALVTLIGGGQGGQSGGNGYAGARSAYGTWSGDGGEGGIPGSAGTGGKVYTVRLPAGTYKYVCGAGGSGGVSAGTTPADGTDGGATELYGDSGKLLYSSADGAVTPNGYANIITGEVYAVSGKADGVRGGKGGRGRGGGEDYNAESVTYNGETWAGGANGMDYIPSTAYSCAGAGGGAAVGAPGADGQDGASYRQPYGGAGGSAAARDAAETLGSGGDGGHGGGGGGGAGYWVSTGDGILYSGAPGAGGKGGPGAAGAPGGLVLYTKSRKAVA